MTESGAFEAIIETLGHNRPLYDTDVPVDHIRGRCVAIGDSFHRFYAEDIRLKERHITLQSVLIGLELLRILKLAAWHQAQRPPDRGYILHQRYPTVWICVTHRLIGVGRQFVSIDMQARTPQHKNHIPLNEVVINHA